MRCLILVAVLAGCPGTEDPPACIDIVTDCQPLYVPTFDNVYANTLVSACGSTAIGCHSPEGRAGGMSFEDPATAHTALLAGRVIAGNAACSEMIVRVSSTGASYQMPPRSAAFDEAELCALVQWIENGAEP